MNAPFAYVTLAPSINYCIELKPREVMISISGILLQHVMTRLRLNGHYFFQSKTSLEGQFPSILILVVLLVENMEAKYIDEVECYVHSTNQTRYR